MVGNLEIFPIYQISLGLSKNQEQKPGPAKGAAWRDRA